VKPVTLVATGGLVEDSGVPRSADRRYIYTVVEKGRQSLGSRNNAAEAGKSSVLTPQG